MNKPLPKELTSQQLKALKATLATILEDVSVIEKVIGPLLLEANRTKSVPVIIFCHDVLQSLRLIPIYARNILKILPEPGTSPNPIEEGVTVLLQGFLGVTKESLIRPRPNYGQTENLFNIMSEFCNLKEYPELGVSAQIAKINIRAVKLHHLAISLRQILDLD